MVVVTATVDVVVEAGRVVVEVEVVDVNDDVVVVVDAFTTARPNSVARAEIQVALVLYAETVR